jgi:DNA-binding NtrC family response regulator
VEDSRFACDALRMLSQRSGARMRRAETIEQARAHLRVYRPDVVLVDLGLPDGRGEDLIRDLAQAGPMQPVVLGMSGDPDGRAAAMAAGAAEFIDKPLRGLAAFQRVILTVLSGHDGALAGRLPDEEMIADSAALHDDLVQAAQVVGMNPGTDQRRYLAGFLAGVARQTRDAALSEATDALRDPGAGLHRLARLLDERLQQSEPFSRHLR